MKTIFTNNTLSESYFDNCSLVESSFNQTKFDNTQIMNCDLRKADFRNASGYYIDLEFNKIKGAKFTYPEVSNLLNSLDIIIE